MIFARVNYTPKMRLRVIFLVGCASACSRGTTGAGCDRVAWPSCVVEGIRIDCRRLATCACFQECEADHFLGSPSYFCYNTSTHPATIKEMTQAPLVPYQRVYPACAVSGTTMKPEALWHEKGPDGCPNRCHDHGMCNRLGECVCYHSLDTPTVAARANLWVGETCAVQDSNAKPCVDPNCSARGRCANGVCVCDAGSSGAACELPARTTSHARPKIYVYDLPPGFNTYQDLVSEERNLGWHLWRSLIHSPHRTTRAHEADYFFIPVFPMGTVANCVGMEAIHHVRQTYPYWNNTRGYNHLMVGGYDWGLCGMSGSAEFKRVRQISSFGLLDVVAEFGGILITCLSQTQTLVEYEELLREQQKRTSVFAPAVRRQRSCRMVGHQRE